MAEEEQKDQRVDWQDDTRRHVQTIAINAMMVMAEEMKLNLDETPWPVEGDHSETWKTEPDDRVIGTWINHMELARRCATGLIALTSFIRAAQIARGEPLKRCIALQQESRNRENFCCEKLMALNSLLTINSVKRNIAIRKAQEAGDQASGLVGAQPKKIILLSGSQEPQQ